MKDDRRLLRLVIVVLAVVGTATTTGRTDAYGYDVRSSAPVSVLAPSGPEGSPVQPSVTWEQPLSPSVEARGTSTTPSARSNATNFVQSAPSSRLLGESLEAAGTVRPGGSAAHHIVAGGSGRAADARAVLTRFGIDINAADNGVFLPANLSSANPGGAAVHSTIHTAAYYDEVNLLLGQATTRGEAIEALDFIRQQLQSGGFP